MDGGAGLEQGVDVWMRTDPTLGFLEEQAASLGLKRGFAQMRAGAPADAAPSESTEQSYDGDAKRRRCDKCDCSVGRCICD